MSPLGIVWFRQDLRIADNPALVAAVADCDRVLPVFVDEPTARGTSSIGAASRVWLHASLGSLAGDLEALGTRLVYGRGDALEVLGTLVEKSGATRVFWNRRYDPESIAIDRDVKESLAALEPRTFRASLLHEPWTVLKGDGEPYRVFTPYWRAVAARIGRDGIEALVTAPSSLADWRENPGAARLLDELFDEGGAQHAVTAHGGSDGGSASLSADLAMLDLLPAEDWHEALIAHWQPGEAGARSRLDAFLGGGEGDGPGAEPGDESAVEHYDKGRDLPSVAGTSKLSPHLHHGEISPTQVLTRLLDGRTIEALGDGETTFTKEIVWREFAYLLLYHHPHMVDAPLDRRFERFAWRDGDAADADLLAWRRGRTGVPIVDAGLRELYATGWMHNRVRMIVASFLVKNLLLPWQAGEAWFRATLVDADIASNSAGWQWVAGSGADAAPYFRVFNPVLQGEKFDKAGDYVRRWVPELESLPAKFVHKPWELAAPERAGLTYPEPLVDLKASRLRALDAFADLKR